MPVAGIVRPDQSPERESPEDVTLLSAAVTVDRTATPQGLTLLGAAEARPRQCGRCRGIFEGDPALHPTALPDWWICTPCREVLLGSVRRHPASSRSTT